MANPNKAIGYFTMEIGIDDSIPTYCGGLGMLAGDTIKAAADLGLPMVACTLLYRGGYVDQSIDRSGNQKEKAVDWDPDTVLEEMPQRVHVPIEGRTVIVRCYRKIWKGVTGKYVPVYFLDTDLPENTARDRKITERLYIGDDMAKLRQRAVLGIAGPRMLRALTHDIDVYHMNEGHGVLLTMELMSEHLSRFDKQKVDAECVRYSREKCVFTTHTPVPAGHDQFKVADVREVVGDHPAFREPELFATGGKGRTVHASIMALNLSRYANGVAKRHGEVSREMFPGYDIDSVTNGIHAPTWASPYMQAIFDKHFPEWRVRTEDLRMATSIADRPLLDAHANAKRDLMEHVRERTGADVSEDRFTITFARRATPYKRPTLFMHDIERLIEAERPAVVLNCIGVVKQMAQGQDPLTAIPVNALFPHRVAKACADSGARLIHFSTDCVFSGRAGPYSEASPPDPADVYGRTKLLGEVNAPNALTLRTSIIGHELGEGTGFLAWVLRSKGTRVSGYARALYTGVTTAWSIAQRIATAASLGTRLGLAALTVQTIVTSAATKAAAAAQWLLNAAMTANPLALVVIALAALGAALVIAWQKSETFRAIVTGAWNRVKSAASSVGSFIASNWKRIGAVVLAAAGPIGWAALAIIKNWSRIKSSASSLLGAVRSAFNAVVSFVKGIPGKIKAAFSGAGSLLSSTGRQIIEGLIGGIKAMAGRAVDAAKGVVSGAVKGAKALLGIKSPSRVFRTIGEQTMDGLVIGLETKRRSVLKTVQNVAKDVSATPIVMGLTDAKGKVTIAGPNAYGRGPTNITVNVRLDSSMTEAEMGRAYKKAIKAAEALGVA